MRHRRVHRRRCSLLTSDDASGSWPVHGVTFYADDRALAASAASFLGEGLRRREPAIAIVTPPHRELLLERLAEQGVGTAAAVHDRRLVLLDAEETLGRILVDGEPDEARFDGVVGELVRGAHVRARTPVRAFGQMVDLLARDGHTPRRPASKRPGTPWSRGAPSASFARTASRAC